MRKIYVFNSERLKVSCNPHKNSGRRKMENIQIKEVTFKDIDQLQQIGKQTFTDTFGSQNSPAFMEEYLKKSFSRDKVSEEISDKNSEIYFAEIDKNIVGYLKVNFDQSQTELKDRNALEIERLYVIKKYLGKKIGQALYDKAINIARHKNLQYVWLGVWEENPRAIRFYEKNGFEKFDKHIFDLGGDKQTDILMKKVLN
ncbi:GNAT family N-acetyltransferase [Christiangramia forsetii]|uniref:PaiA-like polyamine N(1)-acetyltransferase n=2 Tax=Christiangramia forsetii TaxID=411153 RepID=A0M350_CHRFK|nr:PaiA-like polyamine N(1)-acetyltransferase [Christiangramia forsetii KT0803]